jgi:hypothetical protein
MLSIGGRTPSSLLRKASARASVTACGAPAICNQRAGPSCIAVSGSPAMIRLGRVSRSAGCIATHAPDASRSRPDRPWWSGCTWVATIPVTSDGAAQPSSQSQPGSTTTSASSPGTR